MSSFKFPVDQSQLATSLSAYGRIFLRPAHKVGNNIFNRAERQVFADIASGMGKVEGDIIAHAKQLAEVDMGMICGQTFLL